MTETKHQASVVTGDSGGMLVDGLRRKNGQVQLHFVGGTKWYTQTSDRILRIKMEEEPTKPIFGHGVL